MHRKQHETQKHLVVTLLLSALLFASTAVIAVLCLSNRKLQTELEASEHRKTDVPFILSEHEAEQLEDGRIYYSRDTMRPMADRAASLTEFMSMLFPDRIVYYDDHDLVYLPVSPDLKRHTYDMSRLADLENGEKVYTDESGAAVSLKGVDVSEWQENVNWKKVKADGVQFAFIRAGVRGYSSGTVFEDVTARKNLEGANKAGVPAGVYFYTMAVNEKEAVEEADMVLDLIKDYKISWPVVIDVERESGARTEVLTPAERTDIVIAFCERVKTAGYTPMIYCNMRMFVEKLELERLEGYEKWFAQYFSAPYYPYEYGIWQYTSSGTVDGIRGTADLNISFKDYGSIAG